MLFRWQPRGSRPRTRPLFNASPTLNAHKTRLAKLCRPCSALLSCTASEAADVRWVTCLLACVLHLAGPLDFPFCASAYSYMNTYTCIHACTSTSRTGKRNDEEWHNKAGAQAVTAIRPSRIPLKICRMLVKDGVFVDKIFIFGLPFSFSLSIALHPHRIR